MGIATNYSQTMGAVRDLLGLPEFTTEFTLTCSADTLPTVVCTYHPADNPELQQALVEKLGRAFKQLKNVGVVADNTPK